MSGTPGNWLGVAHGEIAETGCHKYYPSNFRGSIAGFIKVLIVAIKDISVDPRYGSGLMFGEYFDDPDLVAATIFHLTSVFPDTVGYVLRYCDVPTGKDPYFAPYDAVGIVNGDRRDPMAGLPLRIPPVNLRGDMQRWPLLAWNEPDGGGQSDAHQNAVRRGQVLLRGEGGLPTGFAKIVQSGGVPIPDEEFRLRYCETKMWLDDQVTELRTRKLSLLALVAPTLTAMRDLIAHGQHRLAVGQLAILLTSHVLNGAEFNRAAFFALDPDEFGELSCVMAHGDDSSEASNAERGRIVRAVASALGLRGLTVRDDLPLARDLVDERVDLNGQSLIAKAWRGESIPDDKIIWLLASTRLVGDVVQIPDELAQPIAFVVDHDDEFFQQHRGRNPGSAVFRSENTKWFGQLWKYSDQQLGIFLFDLAAWSRWDYSQQLIPKCRMSNEVLQAVSAGLGSVAWKFR
ncbi:MAG: hypothetical protein SH850_13755 [Planctomycetaceae bacterium]|nr:hypothetical protein [Planctomycetaceae bacterium]